MKLDPEVLAENKKMALGCLWCSLAMALGFLIARRLDFAVVLGIVVGFLLAVGNFYFMSVGITRALATGDEITAKKKMRVSYIFRTVVMLAVMALSLVVDWMAWLPVLASVFYPRIILTVRNLLLTLDRKRHPEKYREEEEAAAAAAVPYEDDEEEENEDGFEKFVSHFSKGPVPGEEKDKTDKKD